MLSPQEEGGRLQSVNLHDVLSLKRDLSNCKTDIIAQNCADAAERPLSRALLAPLFVAAYGAMPISPHPGTLGLRRDAQV